MDSDRKEVKQETKKKPSVKTSRPSPEFGDQGGYFDLAVRPMLQQGHEGELCGWLREMSLIRAAFNCPHPDCDGRSLAWHPARIVDKYSWTCQQCMRKQSIRDGSFFISIKCDLKMCLQLILGWCQMIPNDIIASHLDVKKHIVKKVYEKCDKVSEAYIKAHPEDWILGHQGAILIVDEFPTGFMTENRLDVTYNSKKRNNNSHTIICIVEAHAIPPRMWLHMIKAPPEPVKMENSDINVGRSSMEKEAVREIMHHCAPGSCIIANNKARCCNYDTLRELKQYNVVSVEQLQKFDPPGKNKLFKNLETIWQTAIEVCEEVQETTQIIGHRIIAMHLWRQRFGSSPSTAFQYMLNHITECYRFT